MAAVPANFDFPIGFIAKNVLHDLYYNYAKLHAFTTFCTIVLKSTRIAWAIYMYYSKIYLIHLGTEFAMYSCIYFDYDNKCSATGDKYTYSVTCIV